MGTDVGERWLLAGPPFGGAPMWEAVIRRWGSSRVRVVDVLALGPEIETASQALADQMRGRSVLLIAHGTALPVAWRAAREGSPAGLVLTNGPLTQLDPVARAAAALTRVAPWSLHPRVAIPALASSLALRRLVVNPYVMDRDTVVALLGGSLDTPEGRAAVQRFLRSMAGSFDRQAAFDGPTLCVWGDADILHPAGIADEARRWFPRLRHVAVPGGRLFHPVERPWSLADAVDDWLARGLTAT
jgi:pimeloyl-ACP methyl ester carboxylesterase